MRLGTSSPLAHGSAEEWASNQIALGCRSVVFPLSANDPEEKIKEYEECAPGKGEFPLRYYVEKMNSIDPDMPVILEHLNTDEEYIHYMDYLKEVLNGI